ncbi:multidrug effflux MFS transporter [Ponticaulis sp.]|uniref:multidrug effflux MFS transporter n=1 Tax=Ponticaulis sp. TaxID=2020902 RepID=UPI000B67124A|nr:multidrug effflux MFS transporter [Ponticaulis sp.]MAI91200.1 Bcr/CflA family drug resistance efflux transporter [Ponticaulis sp.]OUX98514.1 MAG: Bcr/CflA family drug resistance efflux transporter [Hyphomonadaceae bacterium TMED5]
MSAQSPSKLHSALIICVLALLSIFPPLATDMYLAAMGHIAEAFETSHAATELSLSLFFLGLCVGQLIVGPLTDALGRRLPLLIGTGVFTLTSVGLLLTTDITIFNGIRVIQALGACAGMVVGRAIVTDLYHGRKAAQVLTLVVMLMTLGPIVAPSLGSVLLTSFGWQSIFYMLICVGVAAFVLTFFIIPETLPKAARHPDAISRAAPKLFELVKRREFILPALITGFIQAPMFAFITASSGVFQVGFGLSSLEYGLLFGLVASALVIFGQLNNMLLNRLGPRQIMTVALPLFAVATGLFFAVSGSTIIWMIVPPLWLTIGLVGLLTANAMSIAMEGSEGYAGLGSAGIGAVQFGLAFSVSSLVALAGTGSAFPMATTMVICAIAALGLWLVETRLRRTPAALAN